MKNNAGAIKNSDDVILYIGQVPEFKFIDC